VIPQWKDTPRAGNQSEQASSEGTRGKHQAVKWNRIALDDRLHKRRLERGRGKCQLDMHTDSNLVKVVLRVGESQKQGVQWRRRVDKSDVVTSWDVCCCIQEEQKQRKRVALSEAS
jgi:hypothetical protein